MNKLLHALLCTSLSFYLSGCGNGGGGDTNNQLTTTSSSSTSSIASSAASSSSSQIKPSAFAVDLNLSWLITTPTELTDANFAIITVDLSGKILEKRSLEKLSVKQADFNNSEISLTTTLGVNTLLAVDIQKPFNLSVGNTIRNKALLYTPLTSHNISLSLYTTAAYNIYLAELGGQGTFTAANINVTDSKQLQQLQYLIKNANDFIYDFDDMTYGSIENRLVPISTKVEGLVKQNIYNSKHSTQGSVVDLVSNGGMYLYEADQDALDDGEMNYHAFVGKEPSKSLTYNSQKNLFEPTAYEDNSTVGYALGKAGWVDTKGTQQVYSYNNDNSVTISPSGAQGFDYINAPIEAADISGLNIKTFLGLTHNTVGLSKVVDPSKTFPAGSKMYITGVTMPNENYILNGPANVKTIADALSADVTPNTPGFTLVTLVRNEIGVQLVDNSAKTANFYNTTTTPRLWATGNWKNITLPYLTNAADKSAIEFFANTLVDTEGEYNLSADAKGYSFFLAPWEGQLYTGVAIKPTTEPEISDVFNAIAHNAIQSALVGVRNAPAQPSAGNLSKPRKPSALQKLNELNKH